VIRLYLLAGVCAVIFAAGVVTDRLAPVVGANARVAQAEAGAAAWRTNAQGWRAYGTAEAAAFRQSESLRRREQAQAAAALSYAGKLCVDRVRRARASAAAVAAIVSKEPLHDPQGCPVRELVPADSLRDAISPAVLR
jgi:hypothetical protein